MRKQCENMHKLLAALAISLAALCWQDAAAQEASAGNDICVLDPGAKVSLLFERQCLNSQQQNDLPRFSTKRQKVWTWLASQRMDLQAGLLKDDSDVKLIGFGFNYHLTPSTRFSGQSGFGGAPYSPQETVAFGFRVNF